MSEVISRCCWWIFTLTSFSSLRSQVPFKETPAGYLRFIFIGLILPTGTFCLSLQQRTTPTQDHVHILNKPSQLSGGLIEEHVFHLNVETAFSKRGHTLYIKCYITKLKVKSKSVCCHTSALMQIFSMLTLLANKNLLISTKYKVKLLSRCRITVVTR